MAIQVTMEVHLMGPAFCAHFKLVDNVGYRGVLEPIYHSKQTFKLRSSNRMQFYHRKEHE
jgi:hypothetical protein